MNNQSIFVAVTHKEIASLDIILENASTEAMYDIEEARTSTGLSPLALAVILDKTLFAERLSMQYPNLVNVEDRENLIPLQ